MSKAACFVTSPTVERKFQYASETFKKYNPDWKIERIEVNWDGFSFLSEYAKSNVSDYIRFKSIKSLLENYEKVVYLDCDTETFGPFDIVSSLLCDHNLIITPHVCRPPVGADLLAMGEYNAGFLGAAKNNEVIEFLDWLEHKTVQHLKSTGTDPIVTGQSWLRMAPCFLAHCLILRNSGINVAYWNIEEFMDSGKELKMFHYSGLIKATPLDEMSCHSDKKIPDFMVERFKNYRNKVFGT